MEQNTQQSDPHADVVRFLAAHRAAIADLLEQTYVEVGGHYARMSPTDRHAQAQVDAGEIVGQMGSGEVSQHDIDASFQAILTLAVLNDVVRMSESIERRIIAYAQQHLAGDPELCRKVAARATSTSQRFRMNLTAAYTARVREQIEKRPPHGA